MTIRLNIAPRALAACTIGLSAIVLTACGPSERGPAEPVDPAAAEHAREGRSNVREAALTSVDGMARIEVRCWVSSYLGANPIAREQATYYNTYIPDEDVVYGMNIRTEGLAERDDEVDFWAQARLPFKLADRTDTGWEIASPLQMIRILSETEAFIIRESPALNVDGDIAEVERRFILSDEDRAAMAACMPD